MLDLDCTTQFIREHADTLLAAWTEGLKKHDTEDLCLLVSESDGHLRCRAVPRAFCHAVAGMLGFRDQKLFEKLARPPGPGRVWVLLSSPEGDASFGLQIGVEKSV